MSLTDALTKAHAKLSIPVNGLYLPVPKVVESLQRFCRPLVFHNDGYDHDISFSGSCLLFRHRGHNLLLCTRHQLTNAKRTSDQIILVVEEANGRRVGINPNEVSQGVLDPSSDPAYADLADIMIAEYSPRNLGRDLAPHFLSFDLESARDLRTVDPALVDAIFSIGYPAVDTSYDTTFDDNWQLLGVDVVSRWWKLYFKPAAPTVWDAAGTVALEPANNQDPIPDDPDGMSGAPVFFIHGIKAGQPELGFAGIIVRGNRSSRVNMIEAAQIRKALALHLGA
ncbi:MULTISPECIES: hypothetical protein [unclassified Sphingobium]|uniref:hypothetical protein n=1 Tax=unclassified Sphingobium TaxID=2611147 RepID=UPI0035A6154F